MAARLSPWFLCEPGVRPLSSLSKAKATRTIRQTTLRPSSSQGANAAIGFRIRTGYTTAVMLGGPTASPQVLARLRVPLCDLEDADARQPFHVVAEQDEKRGMTLVRQTLKTATTLAAGATRQLMTRARVSGHQVRAATLVVGSDVDPASLRHPHIRAHALEGRLFREAVETGASRCGLSCSVLVERETLASAELAIGKPRTDIKAATDALGKVAGRPWGAQEKMAAIAAWVALVRE